MVKRQIEILGKPPRHVCFDGGYNSLANIEAIKALGVKDAVFHKKKGIPREKMADSEWIYRKLVKFRAGVEGNIGTLKQKYEMRKCNWKGMEPFRAYAWLSTLAYNLKTLSRL